ncbi:MAG TPA: hypothetical protein VLR46_05980 [Candidatus Dormibacteraeota bacterium]|nr:hypothetical protein [Candidatus Dormibacteraeota bacterium]
MTLLLSPPTPVTITLSSDGTPAFIAGPFDGHIRSMGRWKVETEWWNRLVIREYWKVQIDDDLLCELYHDLVRDEWFVERIYD